MCHADIASSVAANPGEVVNFYSITYDANGSTAGITPVMQAAESNNDTYYFALSEGLDLKKSGYSFIGWAEDSQAIDPQYIAGSTISLSSDKPNKTLFAVWRIDKAWDSIAKMQELTPNTCRTRATNATKQLTDERDGKVYWVTKLADGNCWMTQNLDFEPKNTTKYTNATLNNWTGAADATGRYYDPGDFYKVDMSNGSSTGCHEIADGFANAGCTATAGWKTSAANEEEKHFHVGNFYDWYAATNGSWKDANVAGTNASNSVCPSGWQLPKGEIDASGSYGTRLATVGDTTTDVRSLAGVYKLARNDASYTLLRQSPFYFLPGGYINSGRLNNAGAYVYYWSSTSSGPSSAYNLSLYSSGVLPSTSDGHFYGFSVRCLVPSL